MQIPRSYLAAAETGGIIFACGGQNWQTHKSVELFNPATNLWTRIPDMLQERTCAGAAVLKGERSPACVEEGSWL